MARVEVVMPKVGLTVEQATVTQWLVDVGQAIAERDPILEFDTDKATSQIEAPVGGVLSGKSVQAGDIIEVGQIVAYIETGSVQDQ
jgi:pyruvate/2-oxoglutarate dehydrogenase complex dihydrolipoamide acyltransferase (E2) component